MPRCSLTLSLQTSPIYHGALDSLSPVHRRPKDDTSEAPNASLTSVTSEEKKTTDGIQTQCAIYSEDVDRPYDGECQINKASQDSRSVIFSFLASSDIARFCATSKTSFFFVADYELDRVRFIAWIDAETGNYHIEAISSTQKQLAEKDLKTMTCVRDGNQHGCEYLIVPRNSPDFRSAMFIYKPLPMRRDLDESKGYWKLLRSDQNHNDKYADADQITQINALFKHKGIAPMLLDYTSKDGPFRAPIKVIIHDHETGDAREFEVLFWNGSDVDQCSAFQIKTCASGKINYYMHFRSRLPRHLQWVWYDNNRAEYRPYAMGADVSAQLECSFQANLSYNFPQHDECFNNVRLTALRTAFINNFGAAESVKTFLMRFLYDETFDITDAARRNVRSIEQLTVSSDSTFSRNVQRINSDNGYENDLCRNVAAYYQ